MKRRTIIAALLYLAFGVQSLLTIGDKSLANDEAKHIVTGYWLLSHGQCCLGVDNSPGTALFALPLFAMDTSLDPSIHMDTNYHVAGRVFLFGSPSPERMLFAARLAAMAAGFLLLFAASRLAEVLYGPDAGLLTLALLAFDPNLIAHFSLASTDALLAAAAVLAAWRLELFWRRPTLAQAALSGAALGAALLSKFTGVVALAAAAIVMPIAHAGALKERSPVHWLGRLAVLTIACIGTVWLGYGGHLSAAPPFASFPGLAAGFRQARDYASMGMVAFFNGEVGHTWAAYFPETFAIKTPIPLLVLYAIAILLPLASRPRPSLLHWVPLMFALAFFGAGLAAKLNIGLRHILPVYPFLAVQCGALAPLLERLQNRGRPALRGLCLGLLPAWLAVESLLICPDGIAYFNELVGGPRNGWKYLGDSNVDWGQDLKRLKRTMDDLGLSEVILSYVGNTDPEIYGIRYQYLPLMFYGSTHGDTVVDPAREVLAVSVSNLQGIFSRRIDFGWLAGRTPIARAGYGILLYDLTGDAEAHARLALLYQKNDLEGLARKECRKVSVLAAQPGPRVSPELLAAACPSPAAGGAASGRAE